MIINKNPYSRNVKLYMHTLDLKTTYRCLQQSNEKSMKACSTLYVAKRRLIGVWRQVPWEESTTWDFELPSRYFVVIRRAVCLGLSRTRLGRFNLLYIQSLEHFFVKHLKIKLPWLCGDIFMMFFIMLLTFQNLGFFSFSFHKACS